MKYVKILSLAAVAATALLAFGAGTASATKLCTTPNQTASCANAWHEPAGSVVEATLAPGSSILLETTGGSTMLTCTASTIRGKTTNTAETGNPVIVKVEELDYTMCTFPVTVVNTGEIDISHISNTDNGTLTARGTEVTINTGFFGACTYGASAVGAHLGTVVGGKPAKITINALVPLTKNESGLCPAEVRWTASYVFTKPTPLYVTHN
jgi:hypothetical protein